MFGLLSRTKHALGWIGHLYFDNCGSQDYKVKYNLMRSFYSFFNRWFPALLGLHRKVCLLIDGVSAYR